MMLILILFTLYGKKNYTLFLKQNMCVLKTTLLCPGKYCWAIKIMKINEHMRITFKILYIL